MGGWTLSIAILKSCLSTGGWDGGEVVIKVFFSTVVPGLDPGTHVLLCRQSPFFKGGAELAWVTGSEPGHDDVRGGGEMPMNAHDSRRGPFKCPWVQAPADNFPNDAL